MRSREAGPLIATLGVFESRGMKVCGPGGCEQYRVVDPQGKLDKFMQTVLEGACSEYALVSDDEMIGHFGLRDPMEQESSTRKGLLGMLFKGLAKVFLRDWCVELEKEGNVLEDHRSLLAATAIS